MALIPARAGRHAQDAFCLGRTEATVADWRACVAAGQCEWPAERSQQREKDVEPSEDDQLPMGFVSAAAATKYCRWRGGRVPSLDEWSWAYVSGLVEFSVPWGYAYEISAAPSGAEGTLLASRPPGDLCWGDLSLARGYNPKDLRPCRVGSSSGDRTLQGVMDMVGNLAEWVTFEAGSEKMCLAGGSYQPVIRDGGYRYPRASWCGGREYFRPWQHDGVRCAADVLRPAPPVPLAPCFVPSESDRAAAIAIARAVHAAALVGDYHRAVLVLAHHVDGQSIDVVRGQHGLTKAEARQWYVDARVEDMRSNLAGGQIDDFPRDADVVVSCSGWRYHVLTSMGEPVLRRRDDPRRSTSVCLFRRKEGWTTC